MFIYLYNILPLRDALYFDLKVKRNNYQRMINIARKRSSNLTKALRITAVWIAIGLAACSFEILIVYAYDIQHNYFVTIITSKVARPNGPMERPCCLRE